MIRQALRQGSRILVAGQAIGEAEFLPLACGHVDLQGQVEVAGDWIEWLGHGPTMPGGREQVKNAEEANNA